MNEAAGRVVQFGIADHQSEVRLEGEAIIVFPLLQLGAHRTQIHGISDDVEVTDATRVQRLVTMYVVIQLTLVHGP